MTMIDDSPVRCTFVDGTEARNLNVGRLGLCGPEAMQRAIERQWRAAHVPLIEQALFGTEDGGLVHDDSDLPVGELRRLLHDWASVG